MKVKARISNQYCPQKYWDKTKEVETPDDLPNEIITELLYVGKNLIKGRFKNHEIKAKAITLYNTIYMTNYNTGTNCGSCLSTCYDGIKKLYKKYSE
jgi:NAD-dependent dihydropyrimidine dehydrogenase PreA subunit